MTKDNRINADGREEPGAMIRRLAPTRARLQFSIYDHMLEKRAYRAVPGYRALLSIYSRKELLALWRLIRDVVESKGWHDDDAREYGDHDSVAGDRPVVDGTD
jgi:hypothetical protein